MYFMNRAGKYLTRKLGKTILLSIIFIVISNLIIAGLLVEQASKQTQKDARLAVGADITYVLDMQALLKNSDSGIVNNREMAKLLLGGGFSSSELVTDGGGPTYSNLLKITDSEYVEELLFQVSSTSTIESVDGYNNEGNNTFKANLYSGSVPYDDAEEIISLSSGRYPSDEEVAMGAPVTMVADEVMEANNLAIGDYINVNLADINGQSYDVSLEIVGTYAVSGKTSSTQGFKVMGQESIAQNEIYLPFNITSSLGIQIADLADLIITENKITMVDPDNIDVYRDSVEDIVGKYGSLDANDKLYTQIAGPIESLGLVSQIFVIAIVVTGGFIIGLITALTVNERKGEIGILLAIGESKGKIVLQFLLEVLVIAFVAFGISIITGSFLGQELSRVLLDSNIFTSTQTATTSGFGMFGQNMANVQEIQSLKMSINLSTVLQIFGIGTLLTVVSTLIPSLYVMRFNPKEILSSRG